MNKIKVGIIGGAGYTAGELCRLLLNHPHAELGFVHSSSHAGHALADVHEGLIGETDLCFTDRLDWEGIDVLFFCMGHGRSAQFLAEHDVPPTMRIVDLAQDFRLSAPGNDYVYGLPELQRDKIRGARHVANPGCFATAIQLALLPLAAAGRLSGDVVVNAITGSTGAGVKPAATTHFSWRTHNLSVYKVFRHQHVAEIRQSLTQLQPSFSGHALDFIPYRGDFPRGIFCTAYLHTEATQEEVDEMYARYYADAPFTHYVADRDIDLKQVVNTNKALVHAEVFEGRLLITSCIDNLLKGASGQAVENMNLMLGFEPAAGLRLKPQGF